MGLRPAPFFVTFVGRGGGVICNRRSSTTTSGPLFTSRGVTVIVVESPLVVCCNFAGNGLPGNLRAGLANEGLTIFGERPAVAFLAGAFLAGAFLAGAFLAGAFLAGTFLAGAFLAIAFLAGAFLAGAFLAGVFFVATVPPVLR